MHFFKEEHIDDLCPNCKQNHGEDWNSEWHNHIHYKIIFCENCGYKISIRTEFMSSGHFQ